MLIICHLLLGVTWWNSARGFHGNTPEYWPLNTWLLDLNSLLWLNKMFGMHWQNQRCIVWRYKKYDSAIKWLVMFLCQLPFMPCSVGGIYRLSMCQVFGRLLWFSVHAKIHNKKKVFTSFSFSYLVWLAGSNIMNRGSVESLKIYILKQVSDRRRKFSPLRFAFYFSGSLERFRGSVWGLYFCSSPHYPLLLLFKPSAPPNSQSSVHTGSHPHGNTSQAEKYNNAELTRSDSWRLTLSED